MKRIGSPEPGVNTLEGGTDSHAVSIEFERQPLFISAISCLPIYTQVNHACRLSVQDLPRPTRTFRRTHPIDQAIRGGMRTRTTRHLLHVSDDGRLPAARTAVRRAPRGGEDGRRHGDDRREDHRRRRVHLPDPAHRARGRRRPWRPTRRTRRRTTPRRGTRPGDGPGGARRCSGWPGGRSPRPRCGRCSASASTPTARQSWPPT